MPSLSPLTTPVVIVSGNPRAASRTLAVAQTLAARLTARLDIGAVGADDVAIDVIELSDLAHELFAAERPAADAALRRLASAPLAVVATPVYKASYTGLLKAFLDLYGPDGLAGVVVVPVVVSGNPAHALAGEAHLRPVLVELGAIVPTRTFAVTEAQLADLDAVTDAWVTRHLSALARTLGTPEPGASRPLVEVAR
ncbi:NADPH-dependent FMN reductase [Xylanimonas ulmi]|uniref:FMN reductase n=1 Tax=Xylanimonas ulmi TaxID=228973 RepID=A0A4Q7M855_9MICO|nr:NAD(P)H-dependent oxidoreductase [Xylanibacterium ulmi]RZS62319.1 FMN reductase [Xylanibacterium ulmi]